MSFNGVSRKLKGCLKFIGSFKEVFTEHFKGASMNFLGCFKEVTREFQGSFREVSSTFQESFTGFSSKIEGCFK